MRFTGLKTSRSFLLIFKKNWRLPGERSIRNSFKNLSLTEKWLFGVLSFFLIFSSLILLLRVNGQFLIEVPAEGGSLVEGVVGSPRFINPLLTISNADADRDLTSLVYSGLLKSTPDNILVPDLAESYTISENGLTYTFTLKENLRFHDDAPLTTEDIMFTIEQAQNPSLRSPRRANWEGVVVEVLNDREISFTLAQPYAPFLENMTLGILPKHLWENLTADQFAFSLLNVEPIGSGPYRITGIEKDSNNLPVRYTLKAFNGYASEKPFIEKVVFKFYQNEEELIEAYKNGQVESIYGISPEEVGKLKEGGVRVETATLPRVFGLFFNQNKSSIFSDLGVRKALDISLDKQRVIDEVLNGYGVVIDSPVPASFSELSDYPPKEETSTKIETNDRIEKAIEILEDAGWTLAEGETVRKKKTRSEILELRFSISTSNVPDLKKVADILKEEWQKIGAEVEVLVFDANGDLSQNVIRPREYEALLFGISIGKDLDLYPFWHSSQRNDPGFNVALYVNKDTDELLGDARVLQDKKERLKKYQEFEIEVKKDVPAVFIYSPEFIYILPHKIKNFDLGFISAPNDRFANIEEWYVETTNIWKLFN